MTKILTFASAKGGSGKTTLTATFGRFLAEIGNKVLLIDCDEATNGLTLMYISEVNDYPEASGQSRSECVGIFEAYDYLKLNPDLVKIANNVDLIPASFSFSNRVGLEEEEFKAKLLAFLADVKSNYDYILLDAQAGADPISLATLDTVISDLVVIVSEYDPLSAAGVERLRGLARGSLSHERTWVLLNKMLPEFIKSFTEFLSVTHYLPPLPWNADVVRAYSRRELALDFEGGSEFTLAVIQSARAFPFASLVQQVSRWVESRAEVIRQPIDDQYEDLQKMLEASAVEASMIKRDRQRRSSYGKLLFMGLVLCLFISVGAAVWNAVGANKGIISSIDPIVLVVALISAGLIASKETWSDLAFLLLPDSFKGDIRSQLELQRLERQAQIYNSRLKELEFLRTADSSTLIRRVYSSSE